MDGGQDVLGALERSYLFEDLSRTELEPLAAAATLRRLSRGEALWQLGDPADELYVVVEGEVKDTVLDAEGNEVVHFVHGPGMTFGEPGYFAIDHDRIVEVVASVPTVLVRLDRRHLDPFMARHPVIKDRALEGLAAATRWQSTMIASLLQRPLADRIALRLLELADTTAGRVDGLPATTRISQSTLAAMLGVSRENVNRGLATLTASGFVRIVGGRYVIAREAELRQRVASDWPLPRRRDRRLD